VELRRVIEVTRAQLDARQSAVAARESSMPRELGAVQAALPANTAVLAYFVGDVESHAWLLTRGALRHQELPGMDRLQKSVDAALGAPGRPAASADATRALGALLLGDLLDGVDATRMLVISDGPLNGVPFAALPYGTQPDQLLVDRFVLGYSPSLSLAMTGPRHVPAAHTRVAVVSDPVYAADDRRLQLAVGAGGGTYRGPREASPNNLTRLPYSGMEARAVLRALGDSHAIELAGFDATPARVLALPTDDLAVLHFATHALARQDSPDQSALYLSEYTADGHPGARQPHHRRPDRTQWPARGRRGAVRLCHRRRQRAARRRRARTHLRFPGQRLARGGRLVVAHRGRVDGALHERVLPRVPRQGASGRGAAQRAAAHAPGHRAGGLVQFCRPGERFSVSRGLLLEISARRRRSCSG
jgi:hypothetical protein